MIVESADEQPPAFKGLDEDSAFQKVRSPALPATWTASPGCSLRLLFSLQSRQVREPGPGAPSSFLKSGVQ